MDIAPSLLMGVLGVVAGALSCWWLTGSYYHTEPSAREKELWRRITELQAIIEVPPLFWQIWAHYTHELSQNNNGDQTHGKDPASSEATEQQAASGERPRPGDERDARP